MLLVVFGIASGYFVYTALYQSNIQFSEEKAFVDLAKHANYDSLLVKLTPYLKSVTKFKTASKIKRFSRVHPGRYLIKNGMSNNELINMLRIGKQVEIKVTFNNQNSLEDLAGALSRQIAPDSVHLLETMLNKDFIRKNGFNPNNALLMYVPNTYRVFYSISAEKFRKKMLNEYKLFWNKERMQKAKDLGLTPLEVGILASIVQQESNIQKERPRIAGVYLNRLKDNWLLQADPTVKYAYQQQYGKDLVIKRVLNKHKEMDSPYNTYKYTGLPPGPICMPDIVSIDAVLNPEKHSFYYFVADFDKPGYHTFSKSLSEHNRHANTYHRSLNRQGIYH